MFRLHKNKLSKSKERIDFKFSHFKVLQVPKGWDKLFVSIISVETGKTLAKSSKALARNGNCQWTDTLLESVLLPQDESSKGMEDCLLKLVVSMGSARSGILGEVIVNMTSYMSSPASVLASFPLKNCNYGTTLQVKIHCLTQQTKLRDGESKDGHDMDVKSDGSGSTFARSTGSSSSKDLGSASHSGEPETSFSATESRNSYDSAEGSLGRESFSHTENLGGDGHKLTGGQDSKISQNSVPQRNYSLDKPSQSNDLPLNSRIAGSGNHYQKEIASPLKSSSSSKNLLEAAEDTIEELRAEAKLWERSARKLMLDLDLLKKEFSNQSKNHANLEVELSAAYAERDGFRKEVEQKKLLLEKSMVKITENSAFQDEGVTQIQKELENEIKFQAESNANLAMQLNRSQESNIELVSVLQELEETIEKQKFEIENLSLHQSEFIDMESTIKINIEENRKLMLQLQQLQESEKNLQDKVQVLELALWEKCKLSAKEEKVNLEAKLSESLEERHSTDTGFTIGRDEALIREIEALKEKVQDLERDCNELTDENLELLLKLKETKNNPIGGDGSCDVLSSVLSVNSYTSSETEVSEQESRSHSLKGNHKNSVVKDIENYYQPSIHEVRSCEKELQIKVTELSKELTDKMSEIRNLEDHLLSKEKLIGVLKQCQSELEAKVAKLERENIQLEENMEIAARESVITSKCLNDLQNELMILSSSVDSNVSANKILERKSSGLQSEKCELEIHLSELEEENVQLSECITGLEAQVKFLTDERESFRLELENSRSLALSLTDKITGLRIEAETQKVDLKQQLQELQNHWSETQEECESLKRENSKLQATAENLVEDCSSLQISNGELKKQNLELHEQCTCLEVKLMESRKIYSECSNRVEGLEENISSLLEDSALKERIIDSQLDEILEENRNQKEKLIQEKGLLDQLYLERIEEVEKLRQEVECLTKKIDVAHDERDRRVSDSINELSSLCSDKAKLESALQEIQSKMDWTENELYTIKAESEMKVQYLMDELASSKQNQEMQIADHRKMLKWWENKSFNEDKFKTALNDLELKLTVSEYERQQVIEEATNMQIQLPKISHLQDEVLALKNDLNSTKFENEKLVASLHTLSGECENLKKEKIVFVENICTLQKAMSELDDCKQSRVTLEEKLIRMESDLMEKEALCAQEAEIKNEIRQMRRENREYQLKIQLVEEEKDECVNRAHALEAELKMMKEEKQNQKDSSKISRTHSKITPIREHMKNSKNEMSKSNYQHSNSRRKTSSNNDQVQEFVKDQQKQYSKEHPREVDNGYEFHDECADAVDSSDLLSKIQLLENELAEAIAANNKYKVQLNRLLAEDRNSHVDTPRKSTAEGEVGMKERFERTKSSLETELKDIRERYFNMSLKYAEVEAQREELVMKLKDKKNGKKWFS